MKMPAIAPEVQNTLIYIVLGVAAAWFIKSKLTGAGTAIAEGVTETVTTTLNPASDQNFVYLWSSDFLSGFTGVDGPLGTQAHMGVEAVDTWLGSAESWTDYINPTSDKNLVYQTFTGTIGLGGTIADTIEGGFSSAYDWMTGT